MDPHTPATPTRPIGHPPQRGEPMTARIAVRRRVRAELAALAGVDAETVDVTVEDVAGPE